MAISGFKPPPFSGGKTPVKSPATGGGSTGNFAPFLQALSGLGTAMQSQANKPSPTYAPYTTDLGGGSKVSQPPPTKPASTTTPTSTTTGTLIGAPFDSTARWAPNAMELILAQQKRDGLAGGQAGVQAGGDQGLGMNSILQSLGVGSFGDLISKTQAATSADQASSLKAYRDDVLNLMGTGTASTNLIGEYMKGQEGQRNANTLGLFGQVFSPAAGYAGQQLQGQQQMGLQQNQQSWQGGQNTQMQNWQGGQNTQQQQAAAALAQQANNLQLQLQQMQGEQGAAADQRRLELERELAAIRGQQATALQTLQGQQGIASQTLQGQQSAAQQAAATQAAIAAALAQYQNQNPNYGTNIAQGQTTGAGSYNNPIGGGGNNLSVGQMNPPQADNSFNQWYGGQSTGGAGAGNSTGYGGMYNPIYGGSAAVDQWGQNLSRIGMRGRGYV